jgi:hypothetical protein
MSEAEIQKALADVLKINRMVVKQNALIVQTLTLPQLMVSGEWPGAWKEVPEDYFNGKTHE